jgi:hypothetical protein
MRPHGSPCSEQVDLTARRPVEQLGCAPISSHAGEFTRLALPAVAAATGSAAAHICSDQPRRPDPASHRLAPAMGNAVVFEYGANSCSKHRQRLRLYHGRDRPLCSWTLCVMCRGTGI